MERILEKGKNILKYKKVTFILLMLLAIALSSTLCTVKAVSSDTSLKSLTISPSGTGLVQDEDNNKVYRVKVDNNVSSISVNAVPNSSSTQVTVSGNTSLQVGTNKVNVTVTAEDGTSATYIIYVRRADTSIAEENIVPNVQEKKDEEKVNESEEITSTENVLSDKATNDISNAIQNLENANNTENVENQLQNNKTTTEIKKSNNIFLYVIIAVIIAIGLILVAIRIRRK